MARPYPVKPKISERAPINGSPGDFFVSDEVLEMPRGTSAGIFKSAEGALHHWFDHLFDEGDLFLA